MTMPVTSGDVRAVPVGELFTADDGNYSIPLYQRNYTWGEEQIHRLVYDILDEAQQDDSKQYFLGNLVVAPPIAPHDPFEVIDGQQRLTTLYILLTKLQSDPEMPTQVGALHPLTYQARDKATLALRGLADRTLEPADDATHSEDSGILRAFEIIDQLLKSPELRNRLFTPHAIDYLLHRVLIIRMPIDRATDLNRYFEIMNTRGAQLSPVDIVKARLLRQLADPEDRAVLNRVWTACSDMDH